MGGKSAPAPPPVTTPPDNTAQMMQIMQMMMGMMQSASSGMPSVPDIGAAPPVSTPLDVDWASKHNELLEKSRADYQQERASKVGRSDTILTSPLLDERLEEAGSSILTAE